MKTRFFGMVFAAALSATPMTSHAQITWFIAGLIDGTAQSIYRGAKQANASTDTINDLKARQSELTMTPEERQARDDAMKQTFDQLSAHLPESEREAEKDRLLERYMALAPQHPSVTERLDILRDEAAAQKVPKTIQ